MTSSDANSENTRCPWCLGSALYISYHDHEWGFPVDNDQQLFEKISLETFQCGLSWLTILNKRENFRQAFAHFNIDVVAGFSQNDIETLLKNKGIVRHRGKIKAVIHNARCAQKIIRDFGSFAAYIWQYDSTEKHRQVSLPLPNTSPEALRLSADLKKRGWQFFGPTTAYAFLQSMGLVNDHIDTCFVKEQARQARSKFQPPRIHIPLTIQNVRFHS